MQISSSPDFSRTVEQATTDNPSFAPLMTLTSYAAGGTLYWRVAAADEDRNQGDWTQIQQIRLQPPLRLTVSGFPKRKRAGKMSARVLDGRGRPLAGALVRVSGAGLKRLAKRTNVTGQVTFKLRPRKRGKLVFSASKAGFQPAYGSQPAERPRAAAGRGTRRARGWCRARSKAAASLAGVRVRRSTPARPRFTT